MGELLNFVVGALLLVLLVAIGFHMRARSERRKMEEQLRQDRERYNTRRMHVNNVYPHYQRDLPAPIPPPPPRPPRSSGHVPPRPLPSRPAVRGPRPAKAASSDDYGPATSMLGLGAGAAEPFRYRDWAPPAESPTENFSGHGGSSGGGGASASWDDSSSSSSSSSDSGSTGGGNVD